MRGRILKKLGTSLAVFFVRKNIMEPVNIDISSLSLEDAQVLIENLKERAQVINSNLLSTYYPEPGTSPLSRDRYPKHMEVFTAGHDYRERCAMFANRTGKSMGIGAYETACHMTGIYPDWWEGKRFYKPPIVWVCGDTAKTVRDICQQKLLGRPDALGTGMIPQNLLVGTKKKHGIPDAMESFSVRHVSGGTSWGYFKSYEEGRKSFQGTEIDFIWLDEEPPAGIYGECVLRTTDVGYGPGILLLTFTPLLGITPVVLKFLPGGQVPTDQHLRFVIHATWDDAPHLSEAEKADQWARCEPHLRQARAKGVPLLGAGAIYPIHEDDIKVIDFQIPEHFPQAYALDVGWNITAGLWMAHDLDKDIVYLTSEYYQEKRDPLVHAAAIRMRGDWIPGVVDPAALGAGKQKDGICLLDEYTNPAQGIGLDLTPAENAVNAGIHACWMRMQTGRLKVFGSLSKFFEEFRMYRRNENKEIVKEKDHLMDDMKYLILTGIHVATTKPVPVPNSNLININRGSSNWMAA